MKWRYILKEIEIKTGERNVESYYRLQYEVLRRIDDGKTDEVKEYLETKIYQKDTDALTILGLLYFYGVGLEMDKPKGKKMINEAVQKGNTAASWIIKDIYKNTCRSFKQTKDCYRKKCGLVEANFICPNASGRWDFLLSV